MTVDGKGKRKAEEALESADERSQRRREAGEDGDVLPWVEKYRPETLDDVVSHDDITSTIQRFLASNRLPHLLFYGPPGTGKTSTILAIARQIYGTPGQSLDAASKANGGQSLHPTSSSKARSSASALRNYVLELNASDDRGIEVVREQIKNFASTRMMGNKLALANGAGSTGAETPVQSAVAPGFKLIILDECDAMTQAAQQALRRVIEQYTSNVRFCIICNYVNKITPAIQSRCTRFRFKPLQSAFITNRVQQIARNEGVDLGPDGLEALLKLSRGDMRRALNVLQACHALGERVDEAMVYRVTGNPEPADIERIVHGLMNDPFEVAYKDMSAIRVEKGLALQDIIQAVYDILDELTLPKEARVYLLDQLANVEHRLSTGGSEIIQSSALLGAFKMSVEIAARVK